MCFCSSKRHLVFRWDKQNLGQRSKTADVEKSFFYSGRWMILVTWFRTRNQGLMSDEMDITLSNHHEYRYLQGLSKLWVPGSCWLRMGRPWTVRTEWSAIDVRRRRFDGDDDMGAVEWKMVCRNALFRSTMGDLLYIAITFLWIMRRHGTPWYPLCHFFLFRQSRE